MAASPNTSRRQFLAGTVATAAALALPPAPVAEALPIPTAVPKPSKPSWAVGQGDAWNWKPIKAHSEHEARIAWMGQTDGTNGECEEGGPFRAGCDCEECHTYFSLDVERHSGWDGHTVNPGDEHWHKGGMGSSCSRCSEEAYPDMGSKWVSGSVVCEGCLTLDDWDIVDPEYAAEMRADLDDMNATALAPSLSGGN